MQGDMDHPSLAEAIAKKRDRAAFTLLFDHFAPRVNAFLLRTGCERGLAEEITQEVMVTLWRKADLFDPAKSSLSTWLYRIARNQRIDRMRRERVDFRDPADFGLDIADEQPLADMRMDGQAREETLRRALDDLPDEQRALVRLAFFDALSHSEIAERTGLPLGTVKSRIRLAFSKLRRALEQAGVAGAA